ncbi:MAG TPA: hypothetical protein VGF21_12480 [Thermoleophilaceae bacterium]
MRAFALLLILACWLGGLQAEALHVGILYFAPALVLISLLVAERYPGERKLGKWIAAASRRARPRRARPRVARRPARSAGGSPRGGVLLALRLGGRAPPLPLAP